MSYGAARYETCCCCILTSVMISHMAHPVTAIILLALGEVIWHVVYECKVK